MSFGRLILIAVLALGAWQGWSRHQAAADLEAAQDEQGFVSLPPPTNADRSVMIIAALDCPKEAGQRADALATELGRRNIPYRRVDNVNWDFGPEADGAVLNRLSGVMNGPLPIVFIDGKAKSNPTIDEVVATYRASRGPPPVG